jgi:hypothetical protein
LSLRSASAGTVRNARIGTAAACSSSWLARRFREIIVATVGQDRNFFTFVINTGTFSETFETKTNRDDLFLPDRLHLPAF